LQVDLPPYDFPFQRIWKLPKQVRSSAPSAPAGTNCKSVRNQKGKNGKSLKRMVRVLWLTPTKRCTGYTLICIHIYKYIYYIPLYNVNFFIFDRSWRIKHPKHLPKKTIGNID